MKNATSYGSGLVLALALAASAASQSSVIVVDAGGGGDFLDLPPAIAAASNGDILLVRGGSYSGGTIDGKALTVIGDRNASVFVSGAIKIRNTTALQQVAVAGLERIDAPGNCAELVQLEVSSAAAPVWIDRCGIYAEPLGSCISLAATSIVGSTASVAMVDCVSRGGPGPFFNEAGAGLASGPADLHLYHCELEGGDATGTSGFFGGHGLLRAGAGTVFASGCNFSGGDGGDGGVPIGGNPCDGGAGGHGALLLPGSPAVILRSVTLAGGMGGAPFGICAPGAPGQPLVLGSGTVDQASTAFRRFDFPSPARRGEVVAATYQGPPGELVWLIVSGAQQHSYQPLLDGSLLVDVGASFTLFAGVIPAGGTLVKNVPIAFGPLIQGLTLYLQPLHFDLASFRLANGRVLVLLDTMF